MGSVNKVILVGNLGRDAELRYTPGGAAIATINMATTEVWNDKAGQRQEKTEWHRVVLWGKTAESLAEYLTKGKQIYVEGKLVSSTYGKEYGKGKNKITVRHKSWQVKAESIRKLHRAKSTTTGAPATPEPQPDETPF